MQNHSEIAEFLWKIADLVKDDYEAKDYEDVILPYLRTRAVMDAWNLVSQGSTFSEVSIANTRELPILLPSIPEQKEILAHIQRETAKLDDVYRRYEQQLTLLAEYRAALIHECVTGRRAVPG